MRKSRQKGDRLRIGGSKFLLSIIMDENTLFNVFTM